MLSNALMIFDEFENGMAAILAPALEPRGVTSVTGKDLSIHFLAVITAKSHSNQRFFFGWHCAS
jgi:hypothetical protein